MSIVFDTLKLADQLAGGGFTDQQAKTAATAFSDAFRGDLATKADIAELRSEMKTEIANVRTEIAQTKADLIRWLVGAIGFQTVVILGALVTLLKVVVK